MKRVTEVIGHVISRAGRRLLTAGPLAALFVCWGAGGLHAQTPAVTNYAFTATSGTFTPLTGGTTVAAVKADDAVSTAIPIGFTFTYMGTQYTNVYASSNGFLSFNSAISSTATNSLAAGAAGIRPTIAPLWDDLDGTSAGTASYLTTGSAGSRVFTFEWLGWEWNYLANAAVMSFQVKFYEATGKVEFVYQQEAAAYNAGTTGGASIGITATATGAGTYLSLNGTGSSPTPSSGTETLNLATKPAQGQVYAFQAPVSAASALNGTPAVTSVGMTWTPGTGYGQQLYVSTDGVSYSPYGSVVSIATNSGTVSGLSSGTQYYIKVRSYGEGGIVDSTPAIVTTNAGTLSGVIPVGPGQTYTSLTAAFAALDTLGLAGPVQLVLQSGYVSTVETFPILVCTAASATNPVVVYPAVSGLVIDSTSTVSAIDFGGIGQFGAKYVTFDGRVGATGTTTDLVIRQTSSTATAGVGALLFRNEANHNTVQYCSLRSANPSTTGGVVVFSTTTGSSGNDSNTIDHCDVTGSGANLPANGVYSLGTTTTAAQNNSGDTISNCNIFDNFQAGSENNGILLGSGNDSWTISNNHFYQTANRTVTYTATAHSAIKVSNTSATGTFTISGNYIGGNSAAGTGTYVLTSAPAAIKFVAINIAGLSSTATASIQGNTFTNFYIYSSSGGLAATGLYSGIYLNSGIGLIGTVTGNTIGAATGTGLVTGVASTAPTSYGITSDSSAGATISGNSVGGVYSVGNSATVGGTFIGIRTTAGNNTISSNTIGSTSTANSITCSGTSVLTPPVTLALTSGSSSFTGITNTGSGTNSVSSNTVANAYVNSSNTGSTMVGISAASGTNNLTGNTIRDFLTVANNTGTGSTAAALGINFGGSTAATITQNTIYNLASTPATNTTASVVTGIYVSNSGASTVSRNFVHSLNWTGATTGASTPILHGIYDFRGGTATMTYANNMIRLGVDGGGNAITNGAVRIDGIRCNTVSAVTTRYYHNTIVIAGAGAVAASTTAANSHAFRREVAETSDLRNNILLNLRSNAGSTNHKHYVIASSAALTALTSNYNVVQGGGGASPGNGQIFGLDSATDRAAFVANWQASSGKDAASQLVDPKLIAPLGTASTVDLHIQAPPATTPVESSGDATVAGVTDDFDGQARGSLTPVDVGADAGNFLPLDLNGPAITFTPTHPLPDIYQMATRTVTATLTDQSGVDTSTSPPVLYWRKSTGSWQGPISASSISGSGSPVTATFVFDFFSLVGGVAYPDVIQYAVEARDSQGSPVDGSYPAGNAYGATPTSPASFIILQDTAGPVIAFSPTHPLPNILVRSSLNVSASVTDQTGVDTSSSPPILFWRKNSGTWVGPLSASSITGSGSPVTASFLMDFSSQGGVVAGDVIQYAVEARDVQSSPLDGSYPTTNVYAVAPTAPGSFTILDGVSSFPYAENFEAGGGSFTTTAITGTQQWEWGTPAKPAAIQLKGAHGGSSCWITKLTTLNYDTSVQSALVSPWFDFGGFATDPKMQFYHSFRTEAGYDAGVLEKTTDGTTWTKVDATLGTGGNYNTATSTAWYNSNSSSGSIAPPKWSGTGSASYSSAGTGSSGSTGWIQSRTTLTGTAGVPAIRFRWRFYSDISGTDEGWAVDDVRISDDLDVPSITYTALASTASLANRTLTATITDAGTGVAGAPNDPLIFFRKGTSGAWTSAAATSAAGSSYTFTIDYGAIPGGVTNGDTVQYYVAAQDMRSNATTLPAGGDMTTAPSVPNSYVIFLVVNSYPYSQNFESGQGGFYGQAVSGVIQDWEFGAPAKPGATQITGAYSGSNAWVTKLASLNYSASGDSALYSPTFDCTSLGADPRFAFMHTFRMQGGNDAAILEMSLDGGSIWSKVDANLGTGADFGTTNSLSWYNNNAAGSLTTPKWSGTGASGSLGYSQATSGQGASTGWIRSSTVLTGAAGQADVRLRWRFASDATTQDEGWAVDNVTLGADIDPPAINYTALGWTSSFANRVLATTITDASGVASGAGQPLVFFRKGTSGGWTSAPATSVVGSSYTFTIDHSLLGALIAGDTIQYYVAAEDTNGQAATRPFGGDMAAAPATPYSYRFRVSSYPYAQNFESGNGGYSGAIVTGSVQDWEFGTPAKTTQITGAFSGSNCWVTRLSGTYTASADSALVSPPFDFSGFASDPSIQFRGSFYTEAGYDAGILEMSLNSGSSWTKVDATLGTGGNFDTANSLGWYNSSSSSGPISQPKWSGVSTAYSGSTSGQAGSTGWVRSTARLTGTAGQSTVLFRWRFGDDSIGQYEGWAVDDVRVAAELIPPSITVTPLTDTFSTTNRTIIATITDASGLDVSPNDPHIFYRIGLSGPWTSAAATSVAVNDYTFTIDYSPLGGVTGGETIQYYFAAQDAAGNQETSPGGGDMTTAPVAVYDYQILYTAVTTFPYVQNFENGKGGFTAALVNGTAQDWQFGKPAKTSQITGAHSGTHCWVTKLTGSYSASADCALYSPTFDFSALSLDPKLLFRHSFATEHNYDGGILEYSTDSGGTWNKVDPNLGSGADFDTTDSLRWYNNNGSSGPLTPPMFSGRPSTSDGSTSYASASGGQGGSTGWIASRVSLNGMKGLPSVQFRWRFGSDTSVQDLGWAVDDIIVSTDPDPPAIVYTQLCAQPTTNNPTLTAAITDASGVAGAPNDPRIYYRIGSSGPFASAPATSISGSDFTFTIDYLLVGGASIGDLVQYYIEAQDTIGNVGYSPAAGSAAPNAYYIQSPLAGTYAIPGDFPNLTAAVAVLNSAGVSAPVVLELGATYSSGSETFPITFDTEANTCLSSGTAPSTANPVTVKPATGADVTITGSASALIRISGSNSITISGNNGSPGRHLTLQNNQSSACRVIDIMSVGTAVRDHVTIDSCTLYGYRASSSSYGVLAADVGASLAGYFDSITIQNCDIRRTGYGILFGGNGGGLASSTNVQILDNTMTASGSDSLWDRGIFAGGLDGGLIQGNDIANIDGTSGTNDRGIFLNILCTGTTVNANKIHDINNTNSIGWGVWGIGAATGAPATPNTISNNMIWNLRAVGYDITGGTNSPVSDNPIGILLYGSASAAGTSARIYNNSIYLVGPNTVDDPFSFYAASMGIALDEGSAADIRDNIVVNNLGLLAGDGLGSIGLFVSDDPAQLMAGSGNNDYVVNASGGGANYFGFNGLLGAGYTSFATFTSTFTSEAGSYNLDPQFTSSSNLHLVCASPMRGKGLVPPTTATDIDGDTRSATVPDLGADELVESVVPVISTCASDQNATANVSNQAPVPDFTAGIVASDNCTATGNLVITQSPVVGSLVGIGTSPVTITVTDQRGNFSSCVAQFNVAPPSSAEGWMELQVK